MMILFLSQTIFNFIINILKIMLKKEINIKLFSLIIFLEILKLIKAFYIKLIFIFNSLLSNVYII